MIQIYKRYTASHEVDPQKGFTPLCPGELPVPDGQNIVCELNKQSEFAKIRTVSKDVHPSNALWISTKDSPQFTPINIEDEPNINMSWNKHCMSGTYGCELIDGLPKITDYDYVVFKGCEPNLHPYTSVYHDLQKKITTGLIEFYSHNEIETVIVGGLALNIENSPLCVGETIIDLSNAGFRVILNMGSTRWIGSEDGKNKFIQRLIKDYNIIIINSSNDLEFS